MYDHQITEDHTYSLLLYKIEWRELYISIDTLVIGTKY
jgi:hypothetical protein